MIHTKLLISINMIIADLSFLEKVNMAFKSLLIIEQFNIAKKLKKVEKSRLDLFISHQSSSRHRQETCQQEDFRSPHYATPFGG